MHIPLAVWNELAAGAGNPGWSAIRAFCKNRVMPLSQKANELTSAIDPGEAEAMALCQELKADALLIDDQKARQVAEGLGIDCIGSLALLLRAKENEIIPSLRPLFSKLVSNKRYFSRQLLDALLAEAGESPL